MFFSDKYVVHMCTYYVNFQIQMRRRFSRQDYLLCNIQIIVFLLIVILYYVIQANNKLDYL